MSDLKTRLELDKILERIALKAAFSLGKERVLNTEPSFSTLIVNRDLKRLKDAMDLVSEHGVVSFGGISDVSASLSLASKGAVLSIEQLVRIGHFLQGSHRLYKSYLGLDEKYEALDDLFESIVDVPQLMSLIEKSLSDSFEVLDSASSELREIRSNIRRMKGRIDSETASFLSKHKDMLSESVVTLHHGRQSFLIKPGDKNKLEGSILGTSSSGQSVYFEPAFLDKLQREYQGYLHQESEEIEKICRAISADVSQVSEQLNANLETCALLDEIFAKAQWGVSNEGVVAKVTEDSLSFVNARHPLIDSKEVVANTYTLSPPHRMILISGPNTGGKSVTLKTIGLFVSLTLCGCPVLADEASVMMVDNIFVDIGDQQSIEKSLSSFSAHLETISHVTAKATSKSLILLDELGSQTDPLEGESLSMAILDFFRETKSWVVATTHFSRLKKYGTQYPDILNASVEFNMDTLKPTYIYKENVLGESNALYIASQLGIKQSIIEKAEAYKKESTFEEDHLLEILNKKIKDTEDLQEKLLLEKKQLEEEIAAEKIAQNELVASIKKEKMDWLEAKEAEFTSKLDSLELKLKELNKISTPTQRHQLKKEVESLKPTAIVEEIHVGDQVRLKQSSQVGIVEKIERNNVFVSVGTLSMQVKLKDLIRLGKKPVKKKTIKTHRIDRSQTISMECNVIGMRVAEALPIVDKYLDECILRNLPSCRIVHGVGTGQMRTAIHELLRKNKSVASFALASISEGGAGATRVVFKS